MACKKIAVGYSTPIERIKLYNIPALELAKSIIEKGRISHINILMLADKAGINESKLNVGLRELFQTSPHQYRFRFCLKWPKELLEATGDTIDQIATKVGFDTYKGFSTSL